MKKPKEKIAGSTVSMQDFSELTLSFGEEELSVRINKNATHKEKMALLNDTAKEKGGIFGCFKFI
jgi:hypothetical protein